jgi:hypothetical protein
MLLPPRWEPNPSRLEQIAGPTAQGSAELLDYTQTRIVGSCLEPVQRWVTYAKTLGEVLLGDTRLVLESSERLGKLLCEVHVRQG